MTRSDAARKKNPEDRTKVKTGCATCRLVATGRFHHCYTPQECEFRHCISLVLISNRIRKVKCDENKPFCHKCVKTGRTCDGYQSPFRFAPNQSIKSKNTGKTKSDEGLRLIQPNAIEITAQDIDLLNRCLSTKTIFNVKLGCDEEARQILQASLTDLPIRHAVLSLRALREDLETSGDGPASVAQPTRSYYYGLEQYSMALGGLASNLSSPGSNELMSALLCCQIFISIEQVRKNYAAMAQHIIQGLRIMYDYRARPSVDAANKLVPANHAQLPLLDVFIIKLFIAPCKFSDPPTTTDLGGTTLPVCLFSPHYRPVESRQFRTIVPDMRAQLTKVAGLILELLDKVSEVKSVEMAPPLLSERAVLLGSLESWLVEFELGQTETEPISASFLRLFHLILKIILLRALDSSTDLYAELRIQNDLLQDVADSLGDRLRAYTMCNGTGSV